MGPKEERPPRVGQEPYSTSRLNRSRRPLLRRWIATGLLLMAFLACAWFLAVVIDVEIGTHAAVLAIAAALIPVGIVVPIFLWLDAYEAEPTRLLVFAFAWGAVIATTTALLLNTASMILLVSATADPEALAAVLVAPVVEEALKAVGLLVIVLWRREEFDGILDGIVYAGVIASGFAFAENILYFGRAFNETGTEGLVAVFVLRGLVSPFAHPLFTMATGVAVGWSITRGPLQRILAPLAGLLVAIALHAAWNFSAVTGAGGFWYAYLAFQVPVFVAAVVFALWSRYRESAMMRRYLQVYEAYGWVSGVEVRMLTDLAERRVARKWAGQIRGRSGQQAMQAFQDDAVELAMLRRRVEHGVGGEVARERERELLTSMQASRVMLD